MPTIFRNIRSGASQLIVFLKMHTTVRIVLIFSFFTLCFLWTYFGVSTLSTIDDHYFHFRFAEILRQQGFFSSFTHFTTLPFSKMATGAYLIYYNFLFYLAVLPFTYITPLYLGIKLYAVLVAALLCTTVYGALRALSVRYPFFWTVFFIAVTGMSSVWRMFLSRPYVLAPAFLILLVVCFYKKKYAAAAIISFVYFFWHSLTFFFPICIGCLYWFFSYFYIRKHAWQVLLATLGGTIVAIGLCYLVAPGFFIYAKEVIFGTFADTIFGKKVIIPEGIELYPVSFFDFVNQNLFLFALYTIAVSATVVQFVRSWPTVKRLAAGGIQPRNVLIAFLLFFSLLLFLGVVLVSARFADFFVPFAWVFIALVGGELLALLQSEYSVRQRLSLGIAIATLYLLVNNLLLVSDRIATGSAPEEFKKVGEWLASHTSQGDIIFNASWDWFPQLYYWDPHNSYVVGIEPRFFYEYDHELFWTWYHIGVQGYVCKLQVCDELDQALKLSQKNAVNTRKWNSTQGDAIARALTEQFHSTYVVSSSRYRALNAVLDNNSHFRQVYNDNKIYFIYEVIPTQKKK